MRALKATVLAAMTAWSGLALAQQPGGIDPEKLKTAFPPAWEGYETKGPEFEAPMAGLPGFGSVTAQYRDQRGGTNFFEAILRVADMGASGGKMYADYGADYLKGPVDNDTQKSTTVGGMPGLVTMTGDDHMQVETYVAPRILVSASCQKAKPEECVAVLERFDFVTLKRLAEEAP